MTISEQTLDILGEGWPLNGLPGLPIRLIDGDRPWQSDSFEKTPRDRFSASP
ncbi:MAG: hypothetical protein AAFO87_08720 [Cyanobacteria bacterium J06607_6]